MDVFANYNDPPIAEAVVAVLHHNGIEVYVPPGQVGCGMAPLAYGDVETARETVQHNLRVLADLAREGYPILCSEPTAALMLRHDALDLLDDADARLVAGQTVEFTAFLWDLHQQGQLRTDFSRCRSSVGHHVPCHLKALGRPAGGAGAAVVDPGAARAYHRRELLGHGGHVRPEGGELRSVAGGGPADAGGAGPAARAVRLDRVQHLPHANGRRRPANARCTRPSISPWLMAICPNCAQRLQPTDRQLGAAMMLQVRLFARARDLARTDTLHVELPDGATVVDLRRRLAVVCPVLAGLLERSALAVDNEFAADSVVVSADAEVALVPPVSGGSERRWT